MTKNNNESVENVETKVEKALPKSYCIDSWLLFALVFIVGLVRSYAFYSSGSELIYKGIINCFAAFVFIPQIKINSNSTVVIFVAKILAVFAIVAFV